MPKVYSSIKVIKAFTRAGFGVVSQKGSHIKMRGFWEGRIQTVIIPAHKEIALGTFSSILKQASMTKEEFETFY